MTSGRRFAGCTAVCAFAVLGPGAAVASGATVTFSASTGTLDVTDAGAEANRITIDPTPVGVTPRGVDVMDTGAAPIAGAGCTALADRVRCTGSVTQINVSAGGGDDVVINRPTLPAAISRGDGADNLTGFGGAETIDGGPGNDRLRGGGGVDDLNGGDGDDSIFTGGEFTDRVTCGPGNDTVDADDADQIAADCETVTGRTAADRDVGRDPGGGGGAGGGPPLQVFPELRPGACEQVVNGTAADNPLDGTELGDAILGFAGNDLLRGLGGDDCLFGGDGRDRLSGGDGNDFVAGENDADRLSGERGDDRIAGADGADRMGGGAGADTMAGGNGADRMSGGASRDLINGGPGRDRIAGGGANDSIDGHTGRDRISVRGGSRDRVRCGAGRDVVRADRRDRIARDCEVVRGRG